MFSIDPDFKNQEKIESTVSALLICTLGLILPGCSQEVRTPAWHDKPKSLSNAADSDGNMQSMLGLHDISSFDVYVENRIVYLLVSGKSTETDQHTVMRYSRSEDGGHQWTNATHLDLLPTAIGKRGNDIQIAASKQYLLAIWQTEGELPGMGPMVTALSSDYGKTWHQGINPALNDDGNQAYIDVIADQHGLFHITWLEDPEENGYQSLRYARSNDHGEHWSQPITLDDSTCSCCWNTLALTPDNRLHVLYRDSVPRDMALMQSQDGGETWQKVGAVGDFQWHFDGCPHLGGGLTSIESDDLTRMHGMVWTGAEDKAGLYHVITSNYGQSWSIPRKFGDMATHGDIAALAGPHADSLATIWNEMEPDGTAIMLSQSTDGGRSWSTPRRLSDPSRSPTHPRLVATGHGFLALWTEKNASQPQTLIRYAFE